MSQISNLSSTILNIKTDIKSAIINKGQNVNDLFSSYPNAIMNISGGSAQGIKVFDSIANMQSDINSQTGDLAIVYNSIIDNITENTQFQEGTFPETVVLSTAVSDYIGLQFKAVDESIMFDCGGEISSERFNMSCYTDDGSGDYKECRIEYTSSDGLTYTRTRFQINQEDISGNVMDFDTVIVFGSRWGEPTWDDRIGSFIKAGTTSFEGMYKHNGTNYNWANTGLTLNSSEKVYKGKFYGNNIIANGTWIPTTNLNLNQLKDKVNLYSNLSYLTVKDNENVEDLFSSKEKLVTTPNINLRNISNCCEMFSYCPNLISIPNFDMNNVKNTACMFYGCSNVSNIPNFNLNNVENASSMFYGCSNVSNIPNFDTSNVKDFGGFLQYTNISNVPNFVTSNAVNMSYMMANCGNLLEIPNFVTNKVEQLQGTFLGCHNIITVPNLNTSNVKSMAAMFAYCENLRDMPNFDTSNVVNMSQLFENCINLTSIPNLNTTKVNTFGRIFSSCESLITIPNLNTSNVINMQYAFSGCNNLTTVSNLNTCNVRNMIGMFYRCNSLTSIPNFDMSNATNVFSMFENCINLSDVPLLNMSNVTAMGGMYMNCNNLSSSAYANIANSLPNASQVYNSYLANTGLNINKFTSAQNTILKNKGYLEFQQNYYTIVYS